MVSKVFAGSPTLEGDNTIPGAVMPEELKAVIPQIFQAVRDYGCDFYPTIIEMLRDDEISEIVAYNGFPVRYPHWSFGATYEEMQISYELAIRRVSELVINTNPCFIYCLSSNTLVDNITCVAHALGHNDFFKNNIHFRHTDTGAMNKLANNGSRIREYIDRWGKERVTAFMDCVMRLDTLVDPVKAYRKTRRKTVMIKDERKYYEPRRLKVDNDYMEHWIHPDKWVEHEYELIRDKEAADNINLFSEPTRDILGFLRDNAPLKNWQADILSMIYEESVYFYPQRKTKMANEGWASKIDYELMAKQGLVDLGGGIVEYAKDKMGVLGGKYSMNPYKLGFCLFNDIEDRWNKGKFGPEWAKCPLSEKKDWDKKLGLGKEKIFEVRKFYDDYMMINDFFTEDFCNEHEFFEWERNAKGEYVIASRDHKVIKNKLLRHYLNRGLPDIRLADPNFRGRGQFLLEHSWDGRELYHPYMKGVMTAIRSLWNDAVFLVTRNADGEEVVCICDSEKEDDVEIVSRDQFEKEW